MSFPIYRIANSIGDVATYLASIINAKLRAGKRVLWLVPGGSAIAVAVATSKQISGVASDLSICLTDERPGPVGHPGSNWQQLKEAGFEYEQYNYYEVLQNKTQKDEIEEYGAWLERALTNNDFRIGLFGIGADGHTAGILPNSVSAPIAGVVEYYSDSQKQRVSINPSGIAKLDEVVVYAVGSEKAPIIDGLSSIIDAVAVPAQNLKLAAKLVVYNDHKES